MALKLLDKVFKRFSASSEGVSTLQNPSQALLESLLGFPTPAGIAVTKDRAIRCASFLSAVKMLANDIAKMPIYMMATTEVNGRQRTRKATNIPLYTLLKDVPNTWMTAYDMHWNNAFNLLTAGNFYVQKIKDQTGKLLALMPLNPWTMTVRWDTSGPVPLRVFDYQQPNGGKRTFANDEIWTCSHMAMIGTEGHGIIALAKDALAMMMASDETAGRYFANGLAMHGFITSGNPDIVIDEKQAQDVVDALKKEFTGSSRAGKFTFLPGGMKYEKMQLTAVEGQLLESRKWNAEEIARLLGGAPLVVKLGYGDKNSTYASSAAFLEEYFATSLLPLTRSIEQSIMRDLIDPADRATLFAKHDADVILRGSPKERAERDEIEIRSGKKSPNEARIADDLDPVDGLDIHFFPANTGIFDPETGETFIPAQKAAPPEEASGEEPGENPAAPVPAPAKSARLLAIAASMADRIIRKETKSGEPSDVKFIADVLNISQEKAETFCQTRGEVTDIKAALIALAVEE